MLERKYESEIKLMALADRVSDITYSANLEKTRKEIEAHPEHSLEKQVNFLRKYSKALAFQPPQTCEQCKYDFAYLDTFVAGGGELPELTPLQKRTFKEAQENEDLPAYCVLLKHNDFEGNGIICPDFAPNGDKRIEDTLLTYAKQRLEELQ